ncbi:MAG: glycoside hydrolase family 9 protein [Eudoraea sp.]|uniref:glycoside hydrolase family 9 protein n=1 Tax=Eudoraea sp. TaxID=1979955 RepID=UPI003C790912
MKYFLALFEKNNISKFSAIFLGIIFLFSCKGEQPQLGNDYSADIRLNQIGYYPNAIKKAVIVDHQGSSDFSLVDAITKEVVFEGSLSDAKEWDLAGERIRVADFTSFSQAGSYHLYIKNFGLSYPFQIANHVLKPVFLGSVKALYYQRVSSALDEAHAGIWKRALGHPDDSVLYHPSSGRSSGFTSSPGGWYDAGDYNKYIVNASFPLGQLMLLQEQYPNTIADATLNIPESGNGLSDYLDELRYEINWTLSMQDEDGGLFHKLTAKNFEGMVMPDAATSQRYIVGKGTVASLDFVASSAMAYRTFLNVDPPFAEKCLEAAKRAYVWAQENPNMAYENPEDISTGEYGDKNFDDEWFWATAELFLSTSDTSYFNILEKYPVDFYFKTGESWMGYMKFLGMFSLLEHKEKLPNDYYAKLKKGILEQADFLVDKSTNLDYFQAIDDFQWGSNSDVLNAAMIVAYAYRLNRNPEYLTTVQQAMDYILGTNAVGYSFVTGFGQKSPMFIHHRQSAADGIVDPVPGLLSGGPNSRQQDTSEGVLYPENAAPMKSWVDVEGSFASNEICLNWNAPLTYILGFLENESN